MLINPANTWRTLEDRLKWETVPEFRTQLQTVMTHMKCEKAGDLDGSIATMTADAKYRIFSDSPMPVVYDGPDEIRGGFYIPNLDTSSIGEYDVRELVVVKGCIITIGCCRHAILGETLVGMGAVVDDPNAYYLRNTAHMTVVWPFDDDCKLLVGEDVYFGPMDPLGRIAQQKIRPEELAGLVPA